MRVKRYAALAAVAAITCLTVAACGDDGGKVEKKTFPAGSTMERLNKDGKIKIGTKFDQPGFGLKGVDGKPAGFDVEIGKAIAKELGIPADKIEWVETPTPTREQAIQDGKVDMIVATYTINDTRKQKVDFAGPYYVAGQHIMVRNDDNSITGPDTFKEGTKKVCTVKGSTPEAGIKPYLKNEAAQLVVFDTYQKCVDALKQKQVDAVTTDNVILLGYIARNEGQFKLAGSPFTKEPYGIGLKKGDTQFRNWINDQLETIFKDGRYAQAWKDTAGKFDPNLPEAPSVNRY